MNSPALLVDVVATAAAGSTTRVLRVGGEGADIGAVAVRAADLVADIVAAVTVSAGGLGGVDTDELSGPELLASSLALSSAVDVLTVALGRWVAAADRRAVWAGSGARSMAEWLAHRTGRSVGGATDLVRLGEVVTASEVVAGAVAEGALSPSSAVALHGAVLAPPPAADEGDVEALVQCCTGSGPRDAAKAAEVWRLGHEAPSAEEREMRRWEQRGVRFSSPDDGMVTCTAVLPVLEADQLRCVLGSLGGRPGGDEPRTGAQCAADGLLALIRLGGEHAPRAGRRRADLLITLSAESLAGMSDAPGITEFGNAVPAHVVRRLADDLPMRRVLMAGSEVIDLGRRARLASDAQFAALVARDGGCRIEGCAMPAAWCEVDHLHEWARGGRTDLVDLWLLCSHHHRLRHLPGTRVWRPSADATDDVRGGIHDDARSDGSGAGRGARIEMRLASGEVLRARLPGADRAARAQATSRSAAAAANCALYRS